VVLTGEATEPMELRLAPGVVTVVLFDTELDRGAVRLEEERFARLVIGPRELLLEPKAEVEPGARLGQLHLRFAEGALIESAAFSLVANSARVDRQVRVVHQPASPAVWQAALSRERARCARKDEELEALRARCAEASLSGLVLAGVLVDKDITALSVPTKLWGSQQGLEVAWAQAYQAKGRVALAFGVRLAASAPAWAPTEARLTHARTGARLPVLSTRMDRPQLLPGQEALVVVEWEAPTGGSFTLEVPEKEGSRGVRVPGLTLP
jgi:uncharacterized protein (TIGR02268 family)